MNDKRLTEKRFYERIEKELSTIKDINIEHSISKQDKEKHMNTIIKYWKREIYITRKKIKKYESVYPKEITFVEVYHKLLWCPHDDFIVPNKMPKTIEDIINLLKEL